MKAIFTLILATLIVTSSQAQKTDLALKLEKGKVYRQFTNSRSSVTQEFNGQEMNIVMTIKGLVSFLVKGVTKKYYRIDAQYSNLSMSIQTPQGSAEFSSEKKDTTDIFSTILGRLTDISIKITKDRKGRIIDIKKLETLWGSIIKDLDQLSDMEKKQIKAQIMKAYGAKAMKGNIEMVTMIYPDSPVSIGDKWTIDTQLEYGMSAKMTTEYELADITSGYVLIKGRSTIVTADKDAYIEANGMPVKYDLTGSMNSNIKVDKNTGWIIEATVDQKMEGDAYIRENPQLPNGMKIPMTIINKTIITNNSHE